MPFTAREGGPAPFARLSLSAKARALAIALLRETRIGRSNQIGWALPMKRVHDGVPG